MATKGIYFGGRTLKIPGAYGFGDASGLIEISIGALNVVMLMGSSLGGQPNTPLLFNLATETQAVAMLRGGPLQQAIQAAWHPSPDTAVNGADVVIVMRVDPATQSQHTFLDTEAVPAPALTVLSRDWGKHTLNTQVGFLAGLADPTLRRVSIKKLDDADQLVSPDLGNVLGLAYAGNGVATAQVHLVGGVPTLEVLVVGATDGSAGFPVDLTSAFARTVELLAAFISSQTGFNSKVFGASQMPAVQLDPMAAPAPVAAAVVALRAVNGALVDFINANSVSSTAVFNGNGAPVAITGPVFLTGGTDGIPTGANWTAGLHKLESEDGYILVPLTSDPLIQASCLNHVLAMSDITIKKRRVLYVGHGIGDVIFAPDGTVDSTNVRDRIFNLNSGRVFFATPGSYENTGGVKTLWPAWINAAKAAGIKAGGLPQEGLTHKYIQSLGLEGDYNRTAQNTLIDEAASYVIKVKNKGYRFEIGQSAQVRTTNVLESEPGVLHVSDALLTNLENLLEDKYVGVPPAADVASTVNALKRDAERVCEEAANLGMLIAGQDDQGNAVPAFKVTKASFKNRTYHVEVVAAIAVAGNYVTIAAHYIPLQGAA
jgi:hypothetical protein